MGAIALLVAGCFGGSKSASGSSVVRVEPKRLGPPRLQQIGDWIVSRDPSLKAAVAALGSPTRCSLLYQDWSYVEWRPLGVNAVFTTLGGLPKGGDACSSPASVVVNDAHVTGSGWRTDLGLRIGDGTSRLHALYPRATHTTDYHRAFWDIPGDYWRLVTTTEGCVGTCRSETTKVARLIAHVRGGRVVALIIPVGAQGE